MNSGKMKKAIENNGLFISSGGSGEIRTHERLTPSAVFKTPAFVIIINILLTFHFRKAHWFNRHKCLFYLGSQDSCGNDFSGRYRQDTDRLAI
jgi:hypothetical protein